MRNVAARDKDSARGGLCGRKSKLFEGSVTHQAIPGVGEHPLHVLQHRGDRRSRFTPDLRRVVLCQLQHSSYQHMFQAPSTPRSISCIISNRSRGVGRSKFGLHSAKTIIHARQHLVDVREFERGRGDIPVFKLRAQIRGKPIFDARADCSPEPFIGAGTIENSRSTADNSNSDARVKARDPRQVSLGARATLSLRSHKTANYHKRSLLAPSRSEPN